MILAPAAAERNTRTAAEEWRESGVRSCRSSGVAESVHPFTGSEDSLLEPPEASVRELVALLSGYFSDAVRLNS
jgi:hypothetical protein